MNIIKAFVLLVASFAIIFPYSDNCGFPLITGLTINNTGLISELSRSDEIGSISIFSVRNLSTKLLEEIEFELLISDGQTNFYGEVVEIANLHINLSTVEDLFQSFTLTSLDADSLSLQNGIRSAEESILGPPPIINDDTLVNILLMDIRDGFTDSGEFVAGFFDPQDQFMCYDSRDCASESLGYDPTATKTSCLANNYFWKSCGNSENIIYIDSNPSIINEAGLENTLFTLAHEYQHLLHWNADIKEGNFQTNNSEYAFHNPWLNEGISDLMPSILGLGLRDFSHYLDNPSIGLDEWSEIGSSSTLPYYAKSALFFQFLYESQGLDIIGEIFNSTEQGVASIKSIFGNEDFETLFIDWIQSLVMGKLEITHLNMDVDSENIEDYISMGLNNITIETENKLSKYSFALFSVLDYLSIANVEANPELTISLYFENAFFDSEDIAYNGINNVEKIIVYTRDFEIDDLEVDIDYSYISSPKKNNLFMYPNPITAGMFSYVYFGDEANGGLIIELFNLNGRNILIAESIADNYGNHSGQIDINLSSGIYILRSRLDSGITESKFISVIK